MLSTDSIILDILETAKLDGDSLLEDFHISYPSNQIAEESNSIFVACVSSESNLSGYDFESFTDLVEILIVTKQEDYEDAIFVIKTITKRICNLLMEERSKFPNKPVIRNINPEFNRDFVLTRGHIMVEVKTEPVDFDLTDEEIDICGVILNNNKLDVE